VLPNQEVEAPAALCWLIDLLGKRSGGGAGMGRPWEEGAAARQGGRDGRGGGAVLGRRDSRDGRD
jgi:hypothetical protein